MQYIEYRTMLVKRTVPWLLHTEEISFISHDKDLNYGCGQSAVFLFTWNLGSFFACPSFVMFFYTPETLNKVFHL